MFKKWNSIESYYRNKFIYHFFYNNSELKDETFIVSEKLDGACFSILFYKEGYIQFAKRSKVLASDDNFFNYKEAFQKESNKVFIELVQQFCIDQQISLQFIGELVGPGINNRINYGNKDWYWYAIREFDSENSKLLSYQEEKNLITKLLYYSRFNNLYIVYDFKHVPILGTFTINSMQNFFDTVDKINLRQNAMEAHTLFSDTNKELNNLMEGVVIRPSSKNYFSPVGEMFIIKKKNPEFQGNNVKKETFKSPKPKLDSQAEEIFNKAMTYINENRSKDLFSKYGEIEEPNQIGEYIKLYYKDVIEDIEKDTNILDLDKDQRKILNKSLNKQIVSELQNYL